jgi:uncharacterized membrane protein HdeD (DUF308 family)
MNKIQIDKMWKFLLSASALTVIVGAIFKIQHYPYGDLLFYSGIAAWFLFMGIKTIYKKRQQNI